MSAQKSQALFAKHLIGHEIHEKHERLIQIGQVERQAKVEIDRVEEVLVRSERARVQVDIVDDVENRKRQIAE